MKTYLYIFLTLSLSLFMSCNDSQNNTKQEAHQHKDGDNHDHANETDHEHSEDDGHNHESKPSEENHSDEIVFTQSQAKAVDLKTETLQAQPFSYIIKTSGQIQAPQGDEQTVVATTAGIVSFTNAPITDGTAIRAGETLVTISAKNLQNGDPALRAKIEFETAEKEYKRAEELAVDKIISAKQFEQTRLAYENAKNAYQAQAGNMTASGIRVASPISGYIKNRMVNQGEYVSVGQPIATVAQNRRLQLRAEVSENYFKYLKSISSANFRTAYDNSMYKLSDLNGKLISYGKTSGNSSF
ncbi:MAG: efflux RND transporter periplasmic adaptor subunit, partial [Bacteroidales bacterium]